MSPHIQTMELTITMATKPRSVNILLSDQEFQHLCTLATSLHASRSFLIRQMLRCRYQMETDNTPICANGQRCLAPHLHQPTTPNQNHPHP